MDAVAEALRGRRRAGPRLRRRGPHPPGQRVPEQLALHPRRAATSRSTRCTPPTGATSVAPTCWSCSSRAYRVQTIVDYSGLEPDGIFLEGTGAMVLDHVSRVAYTARSHRADTHVLERFCTDFGYEPMAFDAVDSEGVPVYHTNVIACIGTDVALIALEMIPDPSSAASRSASGSRSTGARSSSSPRTRSASSPATPSSCAGVRRRAGAATSWRCPARARAQPASRPGRRDRGVLRDRRRRHPHHRAGGRVGALHDRRRPPRPAARPSSPSSPRPSRRSTRTTRTPLDGSDVVLADEEAYGDLSFDASAGG